MNLKRNIYLLIPKHFRQNIKYFYYGKILYFLYCIKNKFHHGYWDFFNNISLETTTHCNLRCKFCPNSKYDRGLLKNKKIMEKEVFKKIINELAEINYRGKISLYSYGEPLTDDRMPSLISYTKQKLPKAKVEINSNGFLLTIEKYNDLVDRGIDKIGVTQYTDIIAPNMKKVLNYLKSQPKKRNKISYRKLNDLELSNRGGEIELEKSVNYEAPICIYPNSALTIDYEGNLILCCNDYHSSIKFGNLKEKNLIEVLTHSNYKKIMRSIRNKKFKLEICKKCVGLSN